MINVVYCPDHAGVKTVVAGGPGCGLPTVHTHSDETNHACLVVENVDEPNLDGPFPFTVGDGTTVNSAEGWMSYLEKYVP